MAHYAKVENDIVVQVIVADKEFIDSLPDADTWIQTSYNTRGGIHYYPDSNIPDGGLALRKNYAGIGYFYDKNLDAFIPPKPFPSWILDEKTCLWKSPKPKPEEMKSIKLRWDESLVDWIIPPVFIEDLNIDENIESSYVDISTYYQDFEEKQNFIMIKQGNKIGFYSKELNMIIMTNSNAEKIWNYDFVTKAKGDVLIGGLGIGLIVMAIQDKPEVTSITIVEKFEDVKDFVTSKLPFNNKVNVVVSDIYDYVPQEGQKFDTMYIDIYGDQVAHGEWFKQEFSKYKKDENSYLEAWIEFDLSAYKK
jgi:hypothetical protein